MSNRPVLVGYSPTFVRALDRLVRKYPRVAYLAQALIERLERGETPGEQIPGIGFTAYKERLPNPDASRGKSGGFRIVYYIKTTRMVILLAIYSKTERADISPDRIRRIIAEYESDSFLE
jgi:mRNA-degrading endonuclease RelE of RelBE toxin-antitoxin system